MKKTLSSLFVAIFVFAVFSQSTFAFFLPAPKDGTKSDFFSDLTEPSHLKAVTWLKDMGILHGYKDGTFRPKKDITRAEFLKILYETVGMKEVDIDLPFKDVDTKAWYIKYVKEAYFNNVINGYADGNFKPNDPISVAEASKIVGEAFFDVDSLYKSEKSLYKCTGIDSSTLNVWYGKYVAVLNSMCLVPFDAFNAVNFSPDAKMTRGGVAVLVYKAKVSQDNDGQKYSNKLVPKYLPEKGAFIMAAKEAICLIFQAEDPFDAEVGKKALDVYRKYGFDVDGTVATNALNDKYKDDEDVKNALNDGLKKCSSDYVDAQGLLDTPSKARDIQRISDLQKIQLQLVSFHLEGKLYPAKSGKITEELEYAGYGGTNTWAELTSFFGGTFPVDPSSGKNYYYVVAPEGYSFGLFAYVEEAENANAICPAGETPTIILGKPTGTYDPEKWCYALLVQ